MVSFGPLSLLSPERGSHMSRRIDVPLASDLLFSLLQFRVVLLLVIWVMCEVVGIFGSETFGGGDLVHAFDVHVLGLRLLVCTAILIYFLLRVMLGSVLDRSQVVHRFRLFTVVPLIDVSVVTSWAYCAGQIESFVPMLGYAVIILVTGIFSQRYSLMLVVAFTFVSYTCALFLHPLLGAELSLDAIHITPFPATPCSFSVCIFLALLPWVFWLCVLDSTWERQPNL